MKKLFFAPLSILLLFLPLSISSISAQSRDIIEGRVLPDFATAIEWNVNDTLEGCMSRDLPYLPLLDACHFGEYTVRWYFYKSGVLYSFGRAARMHCFFNYEKVPLSNSERELFSKSWRAIANGRWYAVIDVRCGYVYSYEVRGNAFAWQLHQLPCN